MEPLLYTYWLCFLEQVNQPLISLLICKMGRNSDAQLEGLTVRIKCATITVLACLGRGKHTFSSASTAVIDRKSTKGKGFLSQFK